MKCPFRKTIIHKEKRISMYTVHHAQDIEIFEDCYGKECPYFDLDNEQKCKRIKESESDDD